MPPEFFGRDILCLTAIPPGWPKNKVELIVDNITIETPYPCMTILTGYNVTIDIDGTITACPVGRPRNKPLEVGWLIERVVELDENNISIPLYGSREVDVDGERIRCQHKYTMHIECTAGDRGPKLIVIYNKIGKIIALRCVKLGIKHLTALYDRGVTLFIDDVDEHTLYKLTKALIAVAGGEI